MHVTNGMINKISLIIIMYSNFSSEMHSFCQPRGEVGTIYVITTCAICGTEKASSHSTKYWLNFRHFSDIHHWQVIPKPANKYHVEQCCPAFLTLQATENIILEAAGHTGKLKGNDKKLLNINCIVS